MRSRNIKPGFFKNDELGEMKPITRLLFVGLWCYADKAGRFEWRPKRIMAEILPYDNGDLTVIARPLIENGFVVRYQVDGVEYGQVVNFSEHQHPHHTEKDSKLPALDPLTVNNPLGNGDNPSDSLIPDSLIPDSRKELFVRFWDLYPIKNARKKCEPKFLKLSLEIIDLIFKALDWQIPYWELNGQVEQFIPNPPNPETYLNQARWEDEKMEVTEELSEADQIRKEHGLL